MSNDQELVHVQYQSREAADQKHQDDGKENQLFPGGRRGQRHLVVCVQMLGEVVAAAAALKGEAVLAFTQGPGIVQSVILIVKASYIESKVVSRVVDRRSRVHNCWTHSLKEMPDENARKKNIGSVQCYLYVVSQY